MPAVRCTCMGNAIIIFFTPFDPAPYDKKCRSEHQTLFPLFRGEVWGPDYQLSIPSGIQNEASETVGRKFCVDVMVLFLDELQPFQSPRDQADRWCDVEPSLLGSSWRRYSETFLQWLPWDQHFVGTGGFSYLHRVNT